MKVFQGLLLGIFAPWTLWGLALAMMTFLFKIESGYLFEFFLYIWPLVVTFLLSVYYFRQEKKKKKVFLGIIIGSLILYPIFIYAHLFALGDSATCERFFFDLLSSC